VLRGGVPERGHHVGAGAGGIVDGAGHQLSGQRVVALRHADGHLLRGAAVELGRPPGARTGPAGEAPELRREQSLVDELVEMELGCVPGHADPVRRLVPADRSGLRHDEAVQSPPNGLGERREP
jgi:hypothetical protein